MVDLCERRARLRTRYVGNCPHVDRMRDEAQLLKRIRDLLLLMDDRAVEVVDRIDVTRRDDAWRCLVGNALYDPCFSSQFAFGIVVCPIPWQGSGTEIHLTKPLPKSGSHTLPSLSLQPWAVETVSGAFCVLSSGASNVVHGQRLNYFCGRNAKQGLWGFPRRKTQPWTIVIAPLNAKVLKHRVALVRAWM